MALKNYSRVNQSALDCSQLLLKNVCFTEGMVLTRDTKERCYRCTGDVTKDNAYRMISESNKQ